MSARNANRRRGVVVVDEVTGVSKIMDAVAEVVGNGKVGGGPGDVASGNFKVTVVVTEMRTKKKRVKISTCYCQESGSL